MSDETFEYITTDYMISIESNEQTIQPVEYIVELGQEGIPGKQGEKGDPGFSPTVGYNLTNGHLTFTIVNEDGVTVTPDVFDYVMRKDGSNANNAVNMNRLSILNNKSSGAIIASKYIDNTDKMNLEISGYPLKLTGTSYASYAYPNSITIAQGGSSITLGNTTKNNIVIDGTSVRYNGAEIATRSNIGNGTITITQGGVTKGTFTLNQSGNATIALDAGGSVSTNPLHIGYTNEQNTSYNLNLGVDESTNKIISSYTITTSGSYLSMPIKLINGKASPIALIETVDGLYAIGLDYNTNTLGLDTNNKLAVVGAETNFDITKENNGVTYTYTNGFDANNKYYEQVVQDDGNSTTTTDIISKYNLNGSNGIDISVSSSTSDGTFANIRTYNISNKIDNNTIKVNGSGELYADIQVPTYSAGNGIDITSDVIAVDFTDVATATQGSKADTAVQPGDLATVATTGDYTDLINKPTIPTNSDYVDLTTVQKVSGQKTFSNGIATNVIQDIGGTRNLISAGTSSLSIGTANTRLFLYGNTTRPTYYYNGNADLALLSDIPTVNNSTITFTQGGTTKGTITLNQSSDATIALDAGGSPDNPLEPLTDKEGLADVTKYAHSTFDSGKFTVTGTPTITDDGLLYPTIGNGLYTSSIPFDNKSFEFKYSFTPTGTPAQSAGILTFYNGINLYQGNNGGFSLTIPTALTGLSSAYYINVSGVTLNAPVILNLTFNSNTLDLTVSFTQGTTELKTQTITLVTTFASQAIYMQGAWGSDAVGYIDLKYLSVTVDGIPVFNGNKTGVDTYTINGSTVTIPYTLSKTGEKIVNSVYRTDVETVYNNQGYVRYYTLNEGVNYTLPTPPDKGYLPNLSWVLNNMNSIPDYSAGITMDLGNGNFTSPTKGVMVLAGYTTGSDNIGGILRVSINSNVVYTNATNPLGYTYFDLCLPVDSGDVINLLTITTPATINTQKFFPLKEVN